MIEVLDGKLRLLQLKSQLVMDDFEIYRMELVTIENYLSLETDLKTVASLIDNMNLILHASRE